MILAKREAASVVVDLNGAKVPLSPLWRERPAIVVFYSTFASEGCEAQLRELRAVGREHDVAVAAVAFDRQDVDLLRSALGPELPLYTAASKELIAAWKIPWPHSDDTGPAIFIVGTDGEITYRKTCRDQVHCAIRDELAPAFAPAPKAP